MSIDNKYTKSRNLKQFPKSFLSNKKSSFTNSNYDYLDNNTFNLSQFIKENSNKKNKKVLYERRPKNSLPQLSSTIESTITSKIQDENKDDCSSSTIFTHKSNDKEKEKNLIQKELIKPQNDDMKILFEILFDKKYDLLKIRKYIILLQKNFILIGNSLMENDKKFEDNGCYYINKLEELISRYSLFILIYIKGKKQLEAKEIFLLMIKENINYINIIEKKLYNYQKKSTIVLSKFSIYLNTFLKIYSFIIRYCQLFNLNKYLHYFMDKYYKLQVINFKYFAEEDTPNYIKYLFSFFLHHCSYYSILNYFSLKTPIKCLKYILNLYEKDDELSLTNTEKSFLLKNLFNAGILTYVNGQKEQSLYHLKEAKEIISLFIEEELYTVLPNINLLNDNMINCDNSLEKKQKLPIYFFLGENIKDLNNNKQKKSFFFNGNNNQFNYVGKQKMNNHNELIQKIYKSYNKEKFLGEDIKTLVEYGKEKGIWNDNRSDVNLGDFNFLFKNQNIHDLSQNNSKNDNIRKNKIRKGTYNKGPRASHVNFTTQYTMKDFFIPKYYKNPLLRKIELLICEIELDSKNYSRAYEHILNVVYLLILTKLTTKRYKYNKEFNIDQRVATAYLKIIEKIYLEKNNKLSRIKIIDTCNSYINEDDSFSESNNNLRKSQEIMTIKQKKELEKLFIFLSGLSVYQIKILNETQPDNIKRNDLPLYFNDNFIDSLNIKQKREFFDLQAMILSRCFILKNPNKWIIPSNLNLQLLSDEKYLIENEKNKQNLPKNDEINPQLQTIFKKILKSSRITTEIKKFLNENYCLVIKILNNSTDDEIKNIIKYPYIIIDSIKNYKHKTKKLKLRSKNDKSLEYSSTKTQYIDLKELNKKTRISSKTENGQVFLNIGKAKNYMRLNSVQTNMSRNKSSTRSIGFISDRNYKNSGNLTYFTKTVDYERDNDDSYSEEIVLIPEFSYEE